MPEFLKRLAARLPEAWKVVLKRSYYTWQMRRGQFRTEEREFEQLEKYVQPGDWVIDVGANVGHYTAKLSALVGPAGRVVAVEPVPTTFALLTHNSRLFAYPNITLLNIAATACPAALNMAVPSGVAGAYLAHITPKSTGLTILGLPLDALCLPRRVALVKVDAEGHELAVLRGLEALLRRDQPTLIVEISSLASREFLLDLGYGVERLDGSPNCIFKPARALRTKPGMSHLCA